MYTFTSSTSSLSTRKRNSSTMLHSNDKNHNDHTSTPIDVPKPKDVQDGLIAGAFTSAAATASSSSSSSTRTRTDMMDGGDTEDNEGSRKRQATASTRTIPANDDDNPTSTTTTTNDHKTEELEPEPGNNPDLDSDYGPHHKVLLQALEVAVRKGANRWTAKDLKASYPHLSSGPNRTKSFDDVWERSAREMREKMMSQAELIMQHYQVAPALKRLHTAVEEAKERRTAIAAGQGLGAGETTGEGSSTVKSSSLSDVWRPNLSPQALTAAYNLPRYDAVYTRLREEYIQLYKDCERLASEVDGKKRRMDEIKDQVVRANKQLEQTAIKLQDVPNEEIKTWMEDVAGNDRGMRTLAA